MADVPRTVLGIDPGGVGGHTGIVLLDSDTLTLADSWAVSGELDGFLEWYDTTGQHLQPDAVICEHFINRNIKGADLTPCFIEGAVRALWRDVVLQPASGKNSAIPDEALKRFGLYAFPGDHHHDRREAVRHVLWYLKSRYHRPTLTAVSGRDPVTRTV